MSTGLPTASDKTVKQQLVEYLQRVPFERAIEQEAFVQLMEADAESAHPLYPPDARKAFEEAQRVHRARRQSHAAGAFNSNKSVIVVPGFMGSQLRDEGEHGLIWIDPKVYTNPSQLSALMLGQHADDAASGVHEDGAIPLLYAGLKYYLESGRCEVRTAGFDWRIDIDVTAQRLADTIRGYAAEYPRRPLFVVAHSQGSLVARRALQLLGRDAARQAVNRLILLGPASYGTFSAASAIAGSHDMIEALKNYGLEWPADTNAVLQSFTGLYQLLPWKPGTVAMDPATMEAPAFWKSGRDAARLAKFFRWGASIDTAFFNDRTSIILGGDGEEPNTPSAVAFDEHNKLVVTARAHGDGTVTDSCAVLEGVGDVTWERAASHMMLPLNRSVMQAVWRVVRSNVSVQALRGARPLAAANNAPARPAAAAGAKSPDHVVMVAESLRQSAPRGVVAVAQPARMVGVRVTALPEPTDLAELAGVPRAEKSGAGAKASFTATAGPPPADSAEAARLSAGRAALAGPPPAPPCRRLRVFSFDPLLAADPDGLGASTITLELPWDEESADAAKLQPGPVGEYLEVVDYDPASRCCYPPVDLNHPNVLAQHGLPPSETDPRFHQQMVYAVGMATIGVFERALGRTVQWSPYLPRDEDGEVLAKDHPRRKDRPDGEFVRRLRIYPHALRDANAYYDSDRKSLLFGYFPAQSKPGDRVMPAATVFTCLSFDVVAHEMTHAILDGVNRYLLGDSNRDVLAFHEAFADIVALFQHFSHPDVLRAQIGRAGGQLDNESMLGQLAQQFGEAMGLHGSLRNYLGKEEDGVWQPVAPDPTRYATEREPHDRGSLLVAAVFTAFRTVYRTRTRDLFRIASNGTGVVAPGALHPDLVSRLADEAANAARHLLLMAIRALDYLPPVDLTFGDYLRALVTADADLPPADARLYRAAVVDAFRQWGIYPQDVQTLSPDALVWDTPKARTLNLDLAIFRDILALGNGTLKLDRAEMYRLQQKVQGELHDWFQGQFDREPALAAEWGLAAGPEAPRTIRRREPRPENPDDPPREKVPVFEVFSVRRCRHAGPGGQERVDVLVSIVQKRAGYLDAARQKEADADADLWDGRRLREGFEQDFWFRGGVTLIIDPRGGQVRYAVYKKVTSPSRLGEARAFAAGGGGSLGLRGNYFAAGGLNPLALLHACENG